MRLHKLLLLVLLLVVAEGVLAQSRDLAIREDKVHVQTWNKFADDLLKLHEQRIAGREIRTTEQSGGYMGRPDFYREVNYYDAATGWLLSRVQWERANPDTVHVIEVYLHDDHGRVIRDYAAAFLPGFRNAPNQTLINFHNYNGALHAFRSFDASGERIYESCQGALGGQDVFISLEDVEIEDARHDPEGVMSTREYQACFEGLPEAAGKYLTPH